jgi:cob(I)alamin adenosyltransferase
MEETPKKSTPQHRLTRIYTRTGDKGTTQLVGGRRVPKNHPRLNAYGTVDELQVMMGAARDALAQTAAAHPDRDLNFLARLAQHLLYLQNRLFSISADLATPPEDRWPGMPLAGADDVQYLETLIDTLNRDLPPLKDFILPGGDPAVTALHVCRVVCRRAEREVETLAASEPIGEWVRPTLNRLSDAFFVLARRVRQELERAGVAHDEQVWRKDLPVPGWE